MKKRLLSLSLALIMAVLALLSAPFAFAASKTPVWDKYAKAGSHKVSSFTFHLDSTGYDYKVWYPKEIAKMSKRPVLLYCNASGFNYENAPNTNKILELAASRGYVVLNNTDKMCGSGESMDAGFTKLMKLNKTKSSVMYGKLNLKKVVLAGHSQGCNCAVNMCDSTTFPNAKYYKAIYCASLPSQSVSKNGKYDPAKVKVPALLTAGTSGFMEEYTCPLEESLLANQKAMKSDVVIARAIGVKHTGSFENAYPYMLAWFDYQLNGNATAAKAFIGNKPELKTNEKWQDYKLKIYVGKTALTKATGSGKSISLAWKKVGGADGYVIQYSTSSTFKSNNKTVTVEGAASLSKKLTKLTAKKKYYVRVKAYRVVGGKKYYSAWSAKKAVQL